MTDNGEFIGECEIRNAFRICTTMEMAVLIARGLPKATGFDGLDPLHNRAAVVAWATEHDPISAERLVRPKQ